MFNLDKKFDNGFQINISLLTEPQRLHVVQMLDARGIFSMSVSAELKMDEYHWLCFTKDGMSYLPEKAALPIIDYPTLCRAAVQLEAPVACEQGDSRNEIYRYCVSVGIKTGQSPDALWAFYKNGIVHFGGYAKELGWNTISKKEFFDKLQGIYPVVVKKTKRYLKVTNAHKLIVEWIEDKPRGVFSGRVVENGCTGYKIGEVQDWTTSMFEECDYTPSTSENDLKNYDKCQETGGKIVGKIVGVFEFASPAVEQPKKKTLNESLEFLGRCGKPFDELYQMATVLVGENERLEQENAQQKSYIERLEKAEEKYLGEIEELEADFERVNKEADNLQKEAHNFHRDITAANEKIEQLNELVQKQMSELSTLRQPIVTETVYDTQWLNLVVMSYNPIYCLRYDGTVGVQDKDENWTPLPAKDSAPILMNALAKELNGDWDGKGDYWSIHYDLVHEEYLPSEYGNSYEFGQPKFKDEPTAQKVISILNTISPEILKNYFA